MTGAAAVTTSSFAVRKVHSGNHEITEDNAEEMIRLEDADGDGKIC